LDYFRFKIGVVAILLMFVFYVIPFSVLGEEEKTKQNNSETNITKEPGKNGVVYNIKIISLGDKIDLYIDDNLIGTTPFDITLHSSEKIILKGRDSKDRLVLDTVIEGGKTPEFLIIQSPKKPNYLASAGMAILGGVAGYWAAFTFTILMLMYKY